MLCELIEYSAFLSLPQIARQTVEQIQNAARAANLDPDVGPTYLEMEYSGRDSGRKVVRFLVEVAALVGDAQGEVKCHLINSDGPDEWEFYTLHGGRLYRQRAALLREPVEELLLEREAAAVGAMEPAAHDC